MGTGAVIGLALKDVNFYRFVNIPAADCEPLIETLLLSLFAVVPKRKSPLKAACSL